MSITGSCIQLLCYSLVCRLHFLVKCQIKTLPSFPEYPCQTRKSLDERGFPLNFRKCGFCRGSPACGCVLHVNVWCILLALCQVPSMRTKWEKSLGTRKSGLWNHKHNGFQSKMPCPHPHFTHMVRHTPFPLADYFLPLHPQMKVCSDPAINLSTHHIDFRNHIDAGNVNIHSHGHWWTCKPRGSATWFLGTSFILSKSCPQSWDTLSQVPPRCSPSNSSSPCSFF